MKIRIKFAKEGNMKYIGHLDILRYFQRAMRRASMPIKYSEGFSPHQIMSFAAPLGMGLESVGEYMDIAVEDDCPLTSAEAVERLNAVMCPGMRVVSYVKLPEDAANAMSSVESAEYDIYADEEITQVMKKAGSVEAFAQDFLSREMIPETKVNKQGEESVRNIRPFIYKLTVQEIPEGAKIYMHISQGSNNNVKPEAVLRAMLPDFFHGEEFADRSRCRIVRTETCGADGIPLYRCGEEIIK